MKMIFLFFVALMTFASGVQAQIYNAWDTTFVVTPSDTVAIVPGTYLPSGASPRSIFVMNRTSSESLLINFDGTVPVISHGPFSNNSFLLIGPDSYISQANPPDSVILWVPSDSSIVHIHWMYKP